ncbi:MAG: ABC transporter permease [Acidimicrobiia bacterium]
MSGQTPSSTQVLRMIEREWIVWKRIWRGSVFSAFVAPVLYLAAMGVGLGDLIDQSSGNVQGVSYLAFVAPGLLAASLVLNAAGESLWPVLGGVKWVGSYHAAVSTPVESSDVYLGQLLWGVIRGAFNAAVFLVVASVMGGVESVWGVLAIPAAVLGALAIAAPLSAWAIGRDDDASFALIMRLGIFPLFLFSGTFFPVSQLPDAIEWLAVFSPLWHAVELCRGATTGGAAGANTLAAVAVHVVVLVGFVSAGVWFGTRAFRRVLTR